jgi:large subunit ribosomal protein L17
MRHGKYRGHLGVHPTHRWAMIRNMVTSLLKHERIKTTRVRAKEVRRYAEKMITKAKKETLAAKRDVLSFVRERDVVDKLFKTLIYRYAERHGGYTRILKLGPRPGDGADMVFLELVDRPVPEEKTEKKPAKDAKEEAASAKPEKAGPKDKAEKKAGKKEKVEAASKK